MSEVNERHERAALVALLDAGERGTEFVIEALTEPGVAKSIADAVAKAIERDAPICTIIVGNIVRKAVTDYLTSCPAFESAVERAEQDDREAHADAVHDARRDDELTGHGRGK